MDLVVDGSAKSRAKSFVLVRPEIAAQLTGLEFLQGLLDGAHPAPPFAEVADIWLLGCAVHSSLGTGQGHTTTDLHTTFVMAVRIAAALLDFAEETLRDGGVREAELLCTAGNARAEGFYSRQGWRPTDTFDDALWVPSGIR